jgi:hypothetical protein
MMPSDDEAFHDEKLPLEQRARLLREHLGNAASDYTDEMLTKILLMSEEHRALLMRAFMQRSSGDHDNQERQPDVRS